MIRIRIKDSPGGFRGFSVWGHAGSGPRGRDIVCAGVSAVALTAIIGLTEVIPGKISYRILPQGLIYCRLPAELPAAEARDAQLILTVMAAGLEAVWREYGDYVDFAYIGLPVH